jgi:hypothetical protein
MYCGRGKHPLAVDNGDGTLWPAEFFDFFRAVCVGKGFQDESVFGQESVLARNYPL